MAKKGEESLEARYARILEEHADSVMTASGAAERRIAPRIAVNTSGVIASVAELGVKANIEVETRDISTSGVCFLSERPFKAGEECELSVGGAFSLTATVVSCEMEETDSNLLEMRYRVHCRFPDERHGMELLVLAKESEDLD